MPKGHLDRLAGVRVSRHLDAAGAVGNVVSPSDEEACSQHLVDRLAHDPRRVRVGTMLLLHDGHDLRAGDAVTGSLPDGEPDLAEPYRDLVDEDEGLPIGRDAVEDASLEELLVIDGVGSLRRELIWALRAAV